MKHSVFFDNCDNRWDNGLPMGNGCFGGMLFFEEHQLYMPMNHYEVYYNISKNVLPVDILKEYKPNSDPGGSHRRLHKRADDNHPQSGEAFCKYEYFASKAFHKNPYAMEEYSNSYPATGDIIFSFEDNIKSSNHALTLYVEDATIELELRNEHDMLWVKTITAREDCIINKVTQSKELLLTKIRISMEPYRGLDAPEITYYQVDSSTFAYTVTRVLENMTEPFRFSGIIKLVGASGQLISDDTGADICLDKTAKEFSVVTGIFTQWRYEDTFRDGLVKIDEFIKDIEALYVEHKNYWKEFFAKSSITLPDKFLEHVYYVNQYALDCCSGKDGIMKHHACGLNGLWDIRHPNLWGSMWYWDVNIQAAFAGVFSSNHLELGKVFSEGLLSYVNLAENFARDVHNLPGVSIDYPYTMYYCVWPWCAQYLWYFYEFSLDEDYLRQEAYPLFLKLCQFAVALFQYDQETDTYIIYPDISPEQGPLAHNTTVTIASIKYMFQFTIEAAAILEDNDAILADCIRILEKMPSYTFSGPSNWGVHLNDSEDAPDNLWIRHPSLLMPLFPIGEFDLATTDEETLQILSNTINFLEEHCEIGIFQSSWIAAAAARLGRGQTALRLLYEKGIDHMLRSNGLSAEQTERFMNDCLTPRQPLYYPCMMEFTGEMLAAVNEMLLQSQNNLIRVFPAIPDGDREWERMIRNGYDIVEYIDRCVDYEAWRNVRFDSLLAKGAFEVSASMTDGCLDWIRIYSRKGGMVHLTSPFLATDTPVYCEGARIPVSIEKGVVSFDTYPEKYYLIAKTLNAYSKKLEESYNNHVFIRETYTKRKIFIGENRDTDYQKAIDGFLRDWYLGNCRFENHTVYKFDFGVCGEKDYTATWTRQVYAVSGRALLHLPFRFLNAENAQFTVKQGYGFKNSADVSFGDRFIEDRLRRDFAQGTKKVEFLIEVPRGQYELLVISGDDSEASATLLEGPNNYKVGGSVMLKGQYQCELIPVVHKKDGLIQLKISAKPGYRWKLNCVFLNTIKGY